MTFKDLVKEKKSTSIEFNAKNSKEVGQFLSDNGYELIQGDHGKISVEIDGKEVTIFKSDVLSVDGKKLEIIKPYDKRNINESTIDKVAKILGKPQKDGPFKDDEGMWKFKDGSYLKVSDSLSRMKYMAKDGSLVTSFTTVGQVKKYFTQSGLLESEELNEGVDISKFAVAMAKLTDNNDHMSARLLAAKLCGDKKIYEVVRATNNIIDYEGYNPISEYTYQLLNRVHEIGRKKHGQENWDKYIYSNT